MRRDRWQQDAEDFSIPQTPLIDIIFILIIFFLVATTFYTEERDIEVNLPEGTEGTVIEQTDERFIVNIRASGILVVNDDVISLDQLGEMLAARAASGNRQAEIRGDENTPHGKVMQVMNLCKQHGIGDLAITQRIVQQE